MGRAILLSVLLAGAVPLAAGADQGSAGVDLMGVYELAEERDPVLRAARQQNLAVQEEPRQALAGYLPQVDLQFERTFTDQEVIDTETLVFSEGSADYPTSNTVLSLTQPLVRLDRVADYDRAVAVARAADAELLQARQDLMLRTATLYFEVLAARDDYAYTLSEKEAVQTNARLIEAQRAAGLVRATDLRDAQARLATVLAAEAEARQRLYDARQALAEVLGSMPPPLLPVAELPLEPPTPATPEPWVEAARLKNPQVLARLQQREAAREELRRRRMGHAPTLDLVARYNNRDTGGSLFGGGSEIETTDLSFQLNLPIYSGGRVASQVRQGAALLSRSQEELDLARRQVERQVRSSFEGVLSAIARVEAMAQAVAAQALARKAKVEGYDAGLFILLAVLDAERDFNSARRDWSRARYDYILSSLQLKQAAGELDAGDLQRVSQWLGAEPAVEPGTDG